MEADEQNSGLATYEEARSHLHIGKTTFSKLVSDGEFGNPVYVSPRCPRIYWSAIEEYKSRSQAPPRRKKTGEANT